MGRLISVVSDRPGLALPKLLELLNYSKTPASLESIAQIPENEIAQIPENEDSLLNSDEKMIKSHYSKKILSYDYYQDYDSILAKFDLLEQFAITNASCPSFELREFVVLDNYYPLPLEKSVSADKQKLDF